MINALIVCIYVFIAVIALMNIMYFFNILKSKKFAKYKEVKLKEIENQSNDKVDILVILPCLREQNIICESIEYFSNLNTKHVNLHILISCTRRELETNSKYGFNVSSADVARDFIKSLPERGIEYFVFEANDLSNGDRATQMNEAVKDYLSRNSKIDVIAVFDADSRPEYNTFEEVAFEYKQDNSFVYQQPENYVHSVCEMAKGGKKGLILANALYQNMWTVIREIPMFLNYSKNHNKFLYMNGHGMFFPVEIYKKLEFPEHEVTDGIHVGFRVSMLKQNFKPLTCLGYTDPPHEVSKLPQQHKRWFGGAVRVNSCAKWAKGKEKKPGLFYYLAAYWDHIRWATTANAFIVFFVLNLVFLLMTHNVLLMVSMALLILSFILYCFVYPCLSSKIIDPKCRIPLSAILAVPVAILFKSFGPDLLIIERMFNKKVKYQKCER